MILILILCNKVHIIKPQSAETPHRVEQPEPSAFMTGIVRNEETTPTPVPERAGTPPASEPLKLNPMPIHMLVAVLIGFPLIFWVWSQALLHRDVFSIGGVDFFITFWIGTTLIYAAKIGVIARVLASSGWTFADIGYGLSRRRTAILIGGYFAGALALFAFVEISLQHVEFDAAKLESLRGLYPDTTIKRLVFIVMALAGGLSEEITYRGFAIRGLQSLRVRTWPAVVIAAIPFVFQHGLKSIDQFWWFFGSGLALGAIFVLSRRLVPVIIIHWIIILSAMLGVFSAMVN